MTTKAEYWEKYSDRTPAFCIMPYRTLLHVSGIQALTPKCRVVRYYGGCFRIVPCKAYTCMKNSGIISSTELKKNYLLLHLC